MATAEQRAFLDKIGPMAAADMQKTGILASLTVAQAILESGWGKSGLTLKANNLFGIKGTYNGASVSCKTQEWDGSKYITITAAFRKYPGWAESVADHSALFLRLKRYENLRGCTDYKKACQYVREDGYATDPAYTTKLVQLIEKYGLTQYDTPGTPSTGGAGAAGTPGASGGTTTTGGAGSPADGKGAGSMKASVLIQKLREIERNHKTLYVMGCFGAPLTGGNVTRYCQNHDYNKRAKRTAMIKAAANKTPPVFGFDCVNLIKGVLWGWSGDASKTYGGASYKSNGVPDIGADGMIKVCKNVSTDFRTIIPGEAVWLSGHIGVYVGGGVVIECSPAFKNCVQETACLNIGPIAGMNGRKWTKHGKIPYVTYDVAAEKPSTGGTGTAGRPGTSGGTGNTSGASVPSVGAVVAFTGNLHYTSANAANGKPCKPGPAKVTQIVKGAKHPYQLIREIGGGSTVYGWVDAADIATGAEAAILKLAALGVINSPDYWAQVVNSGKVQHLGLLFEKAAAKITKAGTRTTTAKDGVAALVRAGVVDSPEYWLQNCGKVASLDLLLCALGGAV